MVATEIQFSKQGNEYVCKITAGESLGGVIELTQTQRGLVTVYANVEGMPLVYLRTYDNPYGTSVLFAIDLPDGLEVTIKSQTEVTSAVWMQ